MGSKKHKKHKSESKGSSAEHDDTEGTNPEKPLKLVLNLKVGAQQDSAPEDSGPSVSQEERRHKHKKKKKRKSSDRDRERHHEGESLKRPHEDDESEDEEEEATSAWEKGDSSQKSDFDDYNSDETYSPGRRLRERAMREDDGIILKQMLNYLLKTLQNKDVNGFFACPVTDSIAPGYSSIILHPMDFSAMAAKIEGVEYANVMEFKNDFILMCNNAMTYNQPETIYYKEAKRLMQLGIRQLSKEKLLHLKKTHSFLASITLKELGFDESGHVVQIPAPPSAPTEVFQEKMDEINVEPEINRVENEEEAALEILELAKKAAEEAEVTLTKRRPKTDLGFLRLEDDGTTSMTILNPWNDGQVSSTQRVISLGDYMGKLKQGTGSLFKFKEDKRNKVCPETYLCYGPFSCHAPGYDSSFATCTKDESDLLLSTYGGETGVQYAKSVEKFVENAGVSALDMVDKLLDTLTNGQHSKAKVIQEHQKRREEELKQKALQDEMIDKAQKAAEEAERMAFAKDPVQRKLNETAAILGELSDTQSERLSQNPPAHYNFLPQPSDKEMNLAEQATMNLTAMAKQVMPRDVVSTGAVRGALGISSQPAPDGRHTDGTTGSQDPIETGQMENGAPASLLAKVVEDSEDDSSQDEDEGTGDEGGDSDAEMKAESKGEDMNLFGETAPSAMNLLEDADDLSLLSHFDEG